MRREINYNEKKYRLLELLHTEYTRLQAQELRKKIIERLNISERTLVSWLYMSKNKTTEIRYSQLKQLAEIFQVEVDDLVNDDTVENLTSKI